MSNCAICRKPAKPGVVVHRECMELLQKTQQLDDKPLTIEELRGMGGEPVWVESPGAREYGRYGIVAGVDTESMELYLESDFTCSDYGKTWVAYRRKPNEWISVKKRPPEYDAPVWGWDAQCHCAKEVNYLNGEFFDTIGEDANITHWMPMPAPPEEVKTHG